MKRLFVLLAVAFMAITTNLSAQNTSFQDAAREVEAYLREMPVNNYRTIYVGLNTAHANWREYGVAGKMMFPIKGGITLGYLEALNIVKGMPIYVEYGANFQYIYGAENLEDVVIMGNRIGINYRTNIFAVNVPVNASVRLSLANNLIAVTPYAGLNARLNLAGKQVLTSGKDRLENAIFDSSNEEGAAGNDAFNRFQLGLNLGCSATYRVYTFSIGHVFDFSQLSDEGKGRLGVTTIGLGYTF